MDDYESRQIPLDVFVIDMDWHTKDNWSGFTFDPHIFPFAADGMPSSLMYTYSWQSIAVLLDLSRI